ncbi:MAG TPA: hypothetical protein VF488_06395 [Gemmatimonadaceae bacterium]
MATRARTFTAGDAVEIQRGPSDPWEPATYIKSTCYTHRAHQHTVQLPEGKERWMNPKRWIECDPALVKDAIKIDTYTVPTRRIRKAKPQ